MANYVPTGPVSGCPKFSARLTMVDQGHEAKKNRQAPGGERLPSHQKSHQTLGGVRLLAGLPFVCAKCTEAVPLVKTLGRSRKISLPIMTFLLPNGYKLDSV